MKNKITSLLIPVIFLLVGMQQIAFADEMNVPPPAPSSPPPMPAPVAAAPVDVTDDACPCDFSLSEASATIAKMKQTDAMCSVINSIESAKGPSYGISLMIMDMGATMVGKKDNAASTTVKISWGAGFMANKPGVGSSVTRICSKDTAMLNPVSAATPIQNMKQYHACVSDLEKVANLVGITCKSN